MRLNWFSTVIFMDIQENKMFSFMVVKIKIYPVKNLKNESFHLCYQKMIQQKFASPLDNFISISSFYSSSHSIRVNSKFKNTRKALDES